MAVIKSMRELAEALSPKVKSAICDILNVPVAGGRWRLKTRRDSRQLSRIRELVYALAKQSFNRDLIRQRLKLYNSRFVGELAPAYYNKFEAFLKTLENETTD